MISLFDLKILIIIELQIDTEREEFSKRSRPDDEQQNNLMNNIRSGMLEHQHVGPAGIRMPMDLSNSQFHDQPHQQMPHMNPVFLNPMNIPFHGAEKGSAHPQVNIGEASSVGC